MATVQELVDQALLDIGVISQGETPSTAERNEGFSRVNRILSTWSLERRTVYTHKQESFAVASGVSAYTLGSGGTWNTTVRPVRVTGALASASGFQSGCEVLPMAQFRASISNGQGITAVLPSKVGVDAAGALVNVELFPVPSAASVIRLSFWVPLTAFASLGETIAFPVPGYEEALGAELAVVLCPSFGRSVTTELAANMQRAKARIEEANKEEMPVAPQVNQQ